ncbi:MAG: Gfo/Idh/MocA family protein [Gaiellaceae bacterium]
MRAGIVGRGFIGAVHALALRSLGVEVAWEAGRDDDLGGLLDEDRVDVLHVCTPNHVHAAQALAALERGVHVVCEKPLAVTSDECAALIEAADGLVNAVCYHTRTYPLVEHMRSEVASGAIGEITFVHGRYLCDDVLFPASGWRVDPAQSGPAYVVGDLGTHWLDLAEHVTGQHVSEILADFRSFAGGPLEDYAALLLRFDGGAAGSLVLSAGAAGRKNQLLFEVEGRSAGFTWDQEQPTEALFRPVDSPKQVVVKDPMTNAEPARPLSRYPAGHGEGYGEAFRNLFERVYAAVEGREHAPFPTFHDGARGVAAVEAAVASRGAWVTL